MPKNLKFIKRQQTVLCLVDTEEESQCKYRGKRLVFNPMALAGRL